MIVSRKSIDDFTLQLSALGDEAEAEVRAKLTSRMSDLRASGADATEELRSLAASVLDANDETYGASSASLGLRVFGETLGARPGEADDLDVAALVRRSNAASARYWAGFLDGTDEGFERFLDGISAKTRRNVTHMADRASAGLAVTINGRRKGAGIRFARIPNGPSCGFCTMLASRGFVYASRKSAGEFTRFHDHCDCRIVAGTKDTQVEGYDPEGMYRRYRMCRATLGTPDDVWRDWEALPDEEKDKYGDAPRIPVFSDPEKQRELERVAGKNADAFNDYYAHRITAEMDARDREWLWSGREPEIDYTLNPIENYGRPKKLGVYDAASFRETNGEWRDLFAHDMLKNAGFPIKTRPSQAYGEDGVIMEGVTNPDIFIGEQIWEIKSPQPSVPGRAKPGNELRFISDQMRNANHNFDNPYDPYTKKGMGKRDLPRRVVLNLRYRSVDTKSSKFKNKLMAEMRSSHISEVLVIDKDGSIARYVNR